jgi:hypothetical protein
MHQERGYISRITFGAAMILSYLLSRLRRPRRFVWAPALEFRTREVYSTLLFGTQY